MKEYAQNTKQLSRTIQGSGRNQRVGFVDNRMSFMNHHNVIRNLKTSNLTQMARKVAREIYRQRGGVICEVVGDDLYIPSNGGHPHIHAWGDGCRVHHLPGIGGNLINQNKKNQGAVDGATNFLLNLLNLTNVQLAQYGGRDHLIKILHGVLLIDDLF